MIKITTTKNNCYITSDTDKINVGDYFLDMAKLPNQVSLFKVRSERHAKIANNRKEYEKVIATSNTAAKGLHLVSKDFEHEFAKELRNYIKI